VKNVVFGLLLSFPIKLAQFGTQNGSVAKLHFSLVFSNTRQAPQGYFKILEHGTVRENVCQFHFGKWDEWDSYTIVSKVSVFDKQSQNNQALYG